MNTQRERIESLRVQQIPLYEMINYKVTKQRFACKNARVCFFLSSEKH